MLDIFGMDKANTKEAIREISHGVVNGMLDSFDWKLDEKQSEINSLKKKIWELEEQIELLKQKPGEKDGKHKDSKQ